MIQRLWHGWTLPRNARAYEELLRHEIVPGIMARQVSGLRSIDVLRREDGDLVEFLTIMTFDDLDAVKAFAGEDYEHAVVPPDAQALLSHYDGHSKHYDVVHAARES